MKKKILKTGAAIVLSLVLFLGYTMPPVLCTNTTSEANIPSETLETETYLTAGVTRSMVVLAASPRTAEVQILEKSRVTLAPVEVERVETRNKEELISLVQESEGRMTFAQQMKDSALALGYAEDSSIVILAEQEYTNAEENRNYYQNILDEVVEEEAAAAEAQKWIDRENEYPTATAAWKYLKDLGYNDYVTAGIIGNMMAEVGGQTLSLDYTAEGRGYYGLCQWKVTYYPSAQGASRSQQLDLLADTIEDEFATFGYIYKDGFDYSSFLELQDEQAAALAFAKVYERCGSGSHKVRQTNATVAYEYFTK